MGCAPRRTLGHVSDGEALILNIVRIADQAFKSERLLTRHLRCNSDSYDNLSQADIPATWQP